MSRPAVISQKIHHLLEKKHFLSASQILQEIEKVTAVNKTSIYRALEKLSADGILCKQTLASDDIVYELRGDHHDHLVCETCGNVEAIECRTVVPKKTSGFSIQHHHTTFYGVCKTCAK